MKINPKQLEAVLALPGPKDAFGDFSQKDGRWQRQTKARRRSLFGPRANTPFVVRLAYGLDILQEKLI
jgi:hypothetical protein